MGDDFIKKFVKKFLIIIFLLIILFIILKISLYLYYYNTFRKEIAISAFKSYIIDNDLDIDINNYDFILDKDSGDYYIILKENRDWEEFYRYDFLDEAIEYKYEKCLYPYTIDNFLNSKEPKLFWKIFNDICYEFVVIIKKPKDL